MTFELRYHPDVRDVDIPQLNETLKKRIKKAIEECLLISPHQYGEPLRKTLKGYWKLRVGDYRVVYRVVRNEVWIFAIINRIDVYKKIIKRI
ncbi:MAG TPA: type II toxin-antitoxin system RelE/ParE family toxin [Thermodesulfovibrionales bacterium]|nr:type II toxin-antitoxin system RelE/ParE family toxin [Thermodesulfovibrionales bacterium]